ncbi:hypothetical protein [Hymenobacter sp. GOD-10R]|uniref:hypothetical protein n=1 Tax=Hymenobacter sp. GOD-10R TaxID=3093922 RepID=UPI002D79B5BC|nr:hypothetical protein [Hymenobacter sp. GOD-10R]WRQ30256.1 hypothetical protein SD425_08285 [Hymenobacter sp. GOD-10R]
MLLNKLAFAVVNYQKSRGLRYSAANACLLRALLPRIFVPKTIMNKGYKLLLSLLIALAVTCLLLSIPTRLQYSSTVMYMLYIILFYGWWLYLPFAGIHFLLLRFFNRSNWWLSSLVGGVLAITLHTIAKTYPVITSLPHFSERKELDVIGFGIGGAVYGLLYSLWVNKPATKPSM